MDVIFNFHFEPTIFTMVVLIDLVLSGDNAIIIGMAAAKLPPLLRRKAIVWGVGIAVVFRITLAGATLYLLNIIGLKLIGGLLLFFVCYQLWKDLAASKVPEDAETANGEDSDAVDGKIFTPIFLRAMATIIVADMSMSLDNVLGVAGAAHQNMGMLVFGLMLSIVLMAIGANFLANLLDRYQWIGYVGLAVILWVAGVMSYNGFSEVTMYFDA